MTSARRFGPRVKLKDSLRRRFSVQICMSFRPNHREMQHFHTFMATHFSWDPCQRNIIRTLCHSFCNKVPQRSRGPDQAINLCVQSLYQMAISQKSPSICHDISSVLSLVGPGAQQPRGWRWRSGPILVQSIVGFDSKAQLWPFFENILR